MHKNSNLFFIIVGVILCSLFITHYFFVGQAVYGDGIYYFAYARSLVKDHDINFKDELGHHYNHESNNSVHEVNPDILTQTTKTGFIANKYPIGPALYWIIPYFFLDFFANLIHMFSPKFANNGYSDFYQIGIGFLNIFFVVVGLKILYSFLCRFYTDTISILTIASLTFGSNLLYYGSLDIINSHPASFLTSCLFLYAWWKTREKRTIKQWLVLGILTGLMGLTRTQDLIFAVIPLFDYILLLTHGISVKSLKIAISYVAGFAVAFIPQITTWNIVYGSYFKSPYVSSQEGFDFLHPHLIGVLLNFKTGLILWTPLYILGFIGLFILRKRNNILAIYSIIIVFLEYYLISSWSGWSQGESFGIRMLIATLPFLSLGIGQIFMILNMRNKYILYGVLSIFMVYTTFGIGYFFLFAHSPTYDRGQVTRQQSILKIERIFHIKL